MSLRKTPFVSQEYYHIYNRGNSKQTIFHDKGDYLHFIYLLYLSNTTRKFTLRGISINVFQFEQEQNLIYIGAYCLMPNHFHIIITQVQEGGVSKFMQKLTTAYSMYYNNKYSRSGSLFEGKFKSKHVNNDRYLKYLFSYIHLNPIKLIDKDWKKDGIKDKEHTINFLSSYKYSSYQDYFGKHRLESLILNREAFPDYFLNEEKYKDEIYEWLEYDTTP